MKPYWLVLLALAGACAGYQKPTEDLTKSVATARGAQEAGAEEVPEAKLHLTLAHEEIERAKKLMEEDENEEAHRMTMRAAADAELALALAHEAAAKREAEQARMSTQQRKSELAVQGEALDLE